MKNIVVTPFVKEEFRLAEEFAAEIGKFGLEFDNTFCGCYINGGDGFRLRLQTKPYPLAGNSALVKALREAGYLVSVFAPYGWNKRRGFTVSVFRNINLKNLKED